MWNAENIKAGDTCNIIFDTVHRNYHCDKCGQYFVDGTYHSAYFNWFEDFYEEAYEDFNFCPNCGCRVAEYKDPEAYNDEDDEE